MQSQRPPDPKLTIVIGFNGTGKTTLVADLVKQELKNMGRALIVTPDDREWLSVPYFNLRFPQRLGMFRGSRRMIYHSGCLSLIQQHFSDGLLVFDDCKSYFRSAPSQELEYLLIRRRQMKTNMVVVAHGFTEVPPRFYTFANFIVLFHTKDNIDRNRKDVLKDFEAMKQAQERVNKISESNFHYYEIIRQ